MTSVFTVQRYASAILDVIICLVCLTIRLSIHLFHTGIVPKWLCTMMETTPHDNAGFYFSEAKGVAEI